jgi:hypothetical protein
MHFLRLPTLAFPKNERDFGGKWMATDEVGKGTVGDWLKWTGGQLL